MDPHTCLPGQEAGAYYFTQDYPDKTKEATTRSPGLQRMNSLCFVWHESSQAGETGLVFRNRDFQATVVRDLSSPTKVPDIIYLRNAGVYLIGDRLLIPSMILTLEVKNFATLFAPSMWTNICGHSDKRIREQMGLPKAKRRNESRTCHHHQSWLICS
ncbi:hypothetical protein VTN00DRAFT_7914 [Thermoascus crustaceus]|uniref:uncharacterized protein n=1 Tax=Thermoascus crustaceus TaxID=5088 RepID=UPI003743DCE6